MKSFLLPALLALSACSTCDIPHGTYETYGGSESFATLTLAADSYKLLHEYWAPADYKNRTKISEQGKWNCTGSTVEINTKNGLAEAKFQEIGDNPLGLQRTVKALVFQSSKHNVLSKEILYFSEDQ